MSFIDSTPASWLRSTKRSLPRPLPPCGCGCPSTPGMTSFNSMTFVFADECFYVGVTANADYPATLDGLTASAVALSPSSILTILSAAQNQVSVISQGGLTRMYKSPRGDGDKSVAYFPRGTNRGHTRWTRR